MRSPAPTRIGLMDNNDTTRAPIRPSLPTLSGADDWFDTLTRRNSRAHRRRRNDAAEPTPAVAPPQGDRPEAPAVDIGIGDRPIAGRSAVVIAAVCGGLEINAPDGRHRLEKIKREPVDRPGLLEAVAVVLEAFKDE